VSPLVTTPLLIFALTVLLHALALRLFPRWKLLDFPQRYNLKRTPLPYPTGILAVVVFVAVFPLLQAINTRSLGVLGAVIILGASSFIDDRRPLPSLLRLFLQFLAALLIFLAGDCLGGRVCSVTNPLEGTFGGPIIELNGALPVLSAIVTIFWLMLTTNALNWFDGIPGQTTTLSTIGFIILGMLSMSDRVQQPQLALLAFAMAGIAFGCALFDFPPAKVVLGDSGSMFFGLMLGVLTIYAGGKVATAFLVLGVPIVDLAFVIVKRISEGRSPFKGSMTGEHLHHRLLAHGWSPRSIIALTALIGTLFGGGALFLNTTGKFIAAGGLLLVMLGLWTYSRPLSKAVRQ
jgi:UDP-GlcNAc:undecaprenyl-phosphate/decaprenyl-phosphate GlcNAc-1-phosphate transferase